MRGLKLFRILVSSAILSALLIAMYWAVRVKLGVEPERFGRLNDPWLWAATLPPIVIALVLTGWVMLVRPTGARVRARWANERDLKAQGLRAQRGVLLGRFGRKNVVYDGDGHIGVVAPTRSGKGTSFVIPNLLTWHQSVVVLDVKKENWEATAHHRSQFSEIIVLDWMSEGQATHRYNPLHFVRHDSIFLIDDLQLIATELIPVPSNGEKIWAVSARELFVALAAFLFHNDEVYRTGELCGVDPQSDPCLGDIRKLIVSGVNTQQLLCHISAVGRSHGLHPEAIRGLGKYGLMASKQFDGVLGSLTEALVIFASPMACAATATSDFDPVDLRRHRMSVYLVVRPPDIEKLRGILAVFVQQTVNRLMRRLPDPEHEPWRVLMLLDEYRSLGAMRSLAEATATIAGYNVQLALVFQSIGQLREVYGEASTESIVENLAVRLLYPPNSREQAKNISEFLGEETIEVSSISSSLVSLGGSVNRSLGSRSLMAASDTHLLSKDEAIVLSQNGRPALIRLLRYFEGSLFRGLYFDLKKREPASLLPKDPPVIDVPVDGLLKPVDDKEMLEYENAALEVEDEGRVLLDQE